MRCWSPSLRPAAFSATAPLPAPPCRPGFSGYGRLSITRSYGRSVMTAGEQTLERVSPCTGLCRIDSDTGLCLGCARTADEISMWGQGPEENRRRVWAELPDRRRRLGLGLHRLGWTSRDVRTFIASTLRYGGGTWVSGIYGAVAEFSIGNDEPIDLDVSESVITAATSRGAIAFRPTPRIRAFAFGSSPDPARSDVIVLAIARAHAGIAPGDGLN